MKFYVMPVPPEFQEQGDTFVSPQGVEFYYEVELNSDEDQITITDTCGRYMPMDIEGAKDVGEMLLRMVNFVEMKGNINDALFQTIFGKN